IGRPSTYASIIQVLQDRDYVRIDKRRFIPEDRGRLVTAFLTNFFERYVQYGFTADLENQLDDVSGGRIDWKEVLRNFWRDFSAAIEGTKELTISDVLAALDAELGRHFFSDDGSAREPRLCPGCAAGRLSIKPGEPAGERRRGPQLVRELGEHPEGGGAVGLYRGRYGPYVSHDGVFASLPRGADPETLSLEQAVPLLAVQRQKGKGRKRKSGRS